MNPEHQFRFVALLAALAFILLEAGWAWLARRKLYDLRECATTISIVAGHLVTRALEGALLGTAFAFVWRHRLYEMPRWTWWSLLLLIAGYEFLYYWQHRAAHRVRLLWATHRVHHSATRLNFSAGLRLGWTGVLSGNFLFFLPLVWVGFHPFAVIGMLALDLAWQFFLHTEAVGRLGPLEWVLNTPSHHRVHHAVNDGCIDRNFGGMTILFDRLFGTWAPPPRERLRYGLAGTTPEFNPLRLVFGEWVALLRDLRTAPSLRDAVGAVFAPPVSTKEMSDDPRPQHDDRSRPAGSLQLRRERADAAAL